MSRNKNPEVTVNRILLSATRLFLEKGYENTTIQDIVDDLGDLSKGAIYHHFSSKEEIIQAVSDRIGADFSFEKIFQGRESQLNGLEKMREICIYSLTNTKQREWMKAVPDYFHNPKFLTQELYEAVKHIAPMMLPFIEEGVADGSITVTQPEEAIEVFMLLTNIWVNPLVFRDTKEKFKKKIFFLKELLELIGLPILEGEVLDAALSFQEMLED